jgi:hypothetical protein
MIPIPPTSTHKTLFNSANEKTYFLSDIQKFILYVCTVYFKEYYVKLLMKLFSFLRNRTTLRNWSHIVVCKDEKFVEEPLDGHSNPRNFTALSCVDSSTLRRVHLIWLGTTRQKKGWILNLRLRSRKKPLQYWISSSATWHHILGKSNINFHRRDNHKFLHFNHMQISINIQLLYSVVFKFCIIGIRNEWGHV